MTIPVEKLALNIDKTCEILSIGRSTVYKMIGDGRLKSFKIAGRRLISRSEIDRLLTEASNDL